MEDRKFKFAVFTSLTMLIQGLHGEIHMNTKDIKNAYEDAENDMFVVQLQNGRKINAFDADSKMLFDNINEWRNKNQSNTKKFNTIMGL